MLSEISATFQFKTNNITDNANRQMGNPPLTVGDTVATAMPRLQQTPGCGATVCRTHTLRRSARVGFSEIRSLLALSDQRNSPDINTQGKIM